MDRLPYVSLDFDVLIDSVPGPELSFRSERDQQDFVERDFDRRLELVKVGTLLSIAESLEKISRESRANVGKSASVLLG